MQSVKEKVSNVGAKVQEKVEEGKASAQEKVKIRWLTIFLIPISITNPN